jgi:hypothetical protein
MIPYNKDRIIKIVQHNDKNSLNEKIVVKACPA